MFLTIIKLFVGTVHFSQGTEAFIIAKSTPTIENEWRFSDNDLENIEKRTPKWYFEHDYEILNSGEKSVTGEGIHWLLVKLWWISTAGIIFFVLFNIIKFLWRSKRINIIIENKEDVNM